MQNGKNSVIGKLQHMDKKISSKTKRTTMIKAWKIMKPFSMKEISTNVFIFSFGSESDMQIVMTCHSWLFESSLLSLKPFNGCISATKMDFSNEVFGVYMYNLPIGCMNEKIKTNIGKTIDSVK